MSGFRNPVRPIYDGVARDEVREKLGVGGDTVGTSSTEVIDSVSPQFIYCSAVSGLLISQV